MHGDRLYLGAGRCTGPGGERERADRGGAEFRKRGCIRDPVFADPGIIGRKRTCGSRRAVRRLID